MRVAYLGIKGLPSRGGAERVVEALAARVARLGITPIVYCDQAYTPADTVVPGVELVRVAAAAGKHARQTTLNLRAAMHALRYGRYDLIHLHNAEASFVLPLLRLRYRVVATSHGPAYRRAKWSPIAKRLIQAMDVPFMTLSSLTTCVAAPEAQRLSAQYRREVVYIPNGIGAECLPDHASAAPILARHGLTAGNYLLFVAGRIEPTKGAHLAIEAVNHLASDMPLLVVGDDSHMPAYRQQLRELAGPRVRFEPLIERPATLFGLMSGTRCLIFPSSLEAMSMVLLEAVALGTPLVCSDIPENREVLRDDASYFASGNAAALAQQLAWLLANPGASQQMSARARERIRSEYAWDAIAERYIQIYEKVCNRHVQPSVRLHRP